MELQQVLPLMTWLVRLIVVYFVQAWLVRIKLQVKTDFQIRKVFYTWKFSTE